MSPFDWGKDVRHLAITDLERIDRYRRAAYGGSVSDSLASLGVFDTVLSAQFRALRQGMQLVGRAIPIKLHSLVPGQPTPEERAAQEAKWEAEGGHPQKRMMRTVATEPPGSVLVFDCGGDPVGASALGSLKPQFDAVRADTEVLFVVNTRRPFQSAGNSKSRR